MSSRSPTATRRHSCSLTNHAARTKYPCWGEPEVLNRGPAGDGTSLLVLQKRTKLNTNSDVRHWKPQSDRESVDDEDNVNEKESSNDDEDMPAHSHRIAGSVTSKVTFKRQAWRPGTQADLARNRQLRLETKRARRHFAAGHLITDDAVFLASRSLLPIGELLSKMEKLALGHAIHSSKFTRNCKRL
ncbi:hypothetical protein MRX96_007285 [Rhipicephalus microplus]